MATDECEGGFSSRLFDSDLRAAWALAGQVLDATVDDRANPFQKLNSGIREVLTYFGRQAQVLSDLLYDFVA